jgi:transcription elongation factor
MNMHVRVCVCIQIRTCAQYRTDDMLGKTVKLIKGQYKGHLGLVVEATETHVKVEMSTKHKILTVERYVRVTTHNRNLLHYIKKHSI